MLPTPETAGLHGVLLHFGVQCAFQECACHWTDKNVRWTLLTGLLLLAVFLPGCNEHPLSDPYGSWVIDKYLPPQSDTADRAYIDQLRHGEFDTIERDFDPGRVDSSSFPAHLTKMTAIFPQGEPITVKPVGVHLNHGGDTLTTNVTYEYQFADRWVIAGITTNDVTHKILGLTVVQLSDSVENNNRFRLVGKSPLQYSIFGLAVSAIIVSLSAFILCVRTQGLKRKWLWALATLIGVEKIAVNWGTGQLTFGILAVYVPPALATREPYGPWTLGACLPLGAIVFLYRRKKLKTASDAEPKPLLMVENTPAPE
jgi:hypothetical protein